jgi:putative hemolysin
MKFLVALIVVCSSLPVLADGHLKSNAVRIGDQVEYVYVNSFGVDTTLKMTVMTYNSETGAFATKYEVNGAELPGTISADDVEKLGNTKAIYSNCEKMGGAYESLTIPMGTISACHLNNGDAASERWVAKDMRCTDPISKVTDSTGFTVRVEVKSYTCK